MKTKLFTLLFVIVLSGAGLTSCAEEEIMPVDEKTEVKKTKGATSSDDF